MSGRVYFVGAGPGDPDLLTLKAQRLISQAGVIIYAGSLVNPDVLAHARPDAECHDSAGMKLAEQVEVMRAAVQRGQTVVRLHTGDPSLYGAILEQMRELEKVEVPYQIVPGVTSAFAAAAALGIELTVPGDTQTAIFTRVSGRTPVPDGEALRLLAAHRSSLVVFLSAGMIARVVDELRAAGYDDNTPVAVVFRASWPDERVLHGTLADIAARVEAAEITHHALIVVSPALRPEVACGEVQSSHLYGATLDVPQRQPTRAIVTLTRNGTETGLRLLDAMADAVLYAPARFVEQALNEREDIVPFATSIRQTLQSAFAEHSALICVMASGIVVREIAPLLRSKHADPAVVVVDEAGQHAVSLLSGHKGGANDLACQVADLLGGTAVLTTASDVHRLPAVDLLGHEWGWRLREPNNLTALSAALVNGDAVGFVQDAGDESWIPEPLPVNLARYASSETLVDAAPAAALLITSRRVPESVLEAIPHTVVYHPPCLVVGVGCNRGTSADEISAAIEQTLEDEELAALSVATVATIEDKVDEDGLLATCGAHGWPLRVFSRKEIAGVKNLPNPSEWAQKALGVAGVAEPAALLGAEATALLVEKHRFPNVTVAIARSEESKP